MAIIEDHGVEVAARRHGIVVLRNRVADRRGVQAQGRGQVDADMRPFRAFP